MPRRGVAKTCTPSFSTPSVRCPQVSLVLLDKAANPDAKVKLKAVKGSFLSAATGSVSKLSEPEMLSPTAPPSDQVTRVTTPLSL